MIDDPCQAADSFRVVIWRQSDLQLRDFIYLILVFPFCFIARRVSQCGTIKGTRQIFPHTPFSFSLPSSFFLGSTRGTSGTKVRAQTV